MLDKFVKDIKSTLDIGNEFFIPPEKNNSDQETLPWGNYSYESKDKESLDFEALFK